MTKNEFDQFVDFVVTTGLKPPKVLFHHGFEDWYTRASLAKFLCHPAYQCMDNAITLLNTIVDVPVNTPEDIEQKTWVLKRLALLLRKYKHDFSQALTHINAAINLAESIDYNYHVVLRGDLWAERWIILNALQQTATAIAEANQKITAFSADKFVKNNSYLYNAYRFKAQVAGSQGNVVECLRLMKTALSFIRLNDQEKKALAIPFSAKHNNIHILLNSIDLATPKKIAWII